jgi:hypothetical protein
MLREAPVTGSIESIIISWTIETADGPRSAAIDLAAMRRHYRPEPVEDLLDDLQVLCEDVQDAWDAASRRTLRALR